MKKILSIAVALFFATVLNAQVITNNVRQRLDPILAAVQVTDSEKVSLIKVIETFQSKMREAYKENAPDKKEKTAAITAAYENDLQKILGKERYNTWKKAEKAARDAAKAAKSKGAQPQAKESVKVPSAVRGRLDPILAAVTVTDAEKAEIITAILKFQKDTGIARKENDKEKAKQVNTVYQSELKRILGQERYTALKKAEKEARAKNAE